MKLAVLLLVLGVTAQGATYYSSASGSGTTCSLGSPCGLQAGFNKVAAGDTLLVRSVGGTYNSKFTFTTSGSIGSRITVQNYPGEFPIIDGYANTTLNGTITNVATTIVLTNGANFPDGFVITFHDGTEGSEEQVLLGTRSTNTFTGCTRAWNGTTAVGHTTGATVVLGGNQIDTSGSYITFQGLEIKNTDPVRIQTPANSQNAPHLRGEGFFNTGDFNQFRNNVIHDVQDGIFNGAQASGTEIYGNVVYNNGYVAAGAYNGHGLYIIHEDPTQTCNIKDNIIFNNSNHGIKGDSQNGSTVNVNTEGNFSFNSGAWANGASRNYNELLSTNNGVASGLVTKDSCFFHLSGKNGTNVKIDAAGGDASVTGNRIAFGIPVDISNSKPLTFSNNSIRSSNNTSGGNNTTVLHIPATSPSTSWDSNSYFNSVTGGAGYYYNTGSSNLNFATWKSTSGFDGSSTETLSAPVSNWVVVRPNAYDNNRANGAIYNWVGGTTATASLAGIFNNGDTVAMHIVEEGTYPAGTPAATGTVSGGNLTVTVNGSTVVSQIGSDGSVIITPITMRPTFTAVVFVRTQSVGGQSGLSGNVGLSGKVKVQP